MDGKKLSTPVQFAGSRRQGLVGGAYLVGLHKGLGPHVKLRLWWGGNVAAVAVEDWVGAMAAHCG